MSAVHDIDKIITPGILTNLHDDMPPVTCIVWKGGEEYETIILDTLYPFDTIDQLKRVICTYYKDIPYFIPKYIFIGVPTGGSGTNIAEQALPTLKTVYLAVDYLWFPAGRTEARDTIILNNPRQSVIYTDPRFSTADGSFPPYSYSPRGRSTIEDIFIRPREGKLPVFHVFPLHYIMSEYTGQRPVSEQEWNRRIAPYFIDISSDGPYEPNEDDLRFAQDIHTFVNNRQTSLDSIDKLLSSGDEHTIEFPEFQMTGIRQIRLLLNKPPIRFEGVESLFYKLLVSESRPFIRLLPASVNTPISKIHIKGVAPIPTIDTPELILQWVKEVSPTPDRDFIYIKYVHKQRTDFSPTIYGTIRIFSDGSADILIQPHKHIRKLDPVFDFRNFGNILKQATIGMPQNVSLFRLGEISAMFSIKISPKLPRFTKKRLTDRIKLFHPFFHEIRPLPGQTPILSIRYKAISQFASEDKFFSFLTQFTTDKILEGESIASDILRALRDAFEISEKEATTIIKRWMEQRGTFTIAVPEENEFMESYNPGIDIHIYSQHPFYTFHINRVDSVDTNRRIISLLSILFVEDDTVFKADTSTVLPMVDNEIERESLQREYSVFGFEPGTAIDNIHGNTGARTMAVPSIINGEQEATANTFTNELTNEMQEFLMAQAGTNTNITEPIQHVQEPPTISIKPPPPPPSTKQTNTPDIVDPRSWFIKKLREIDPGLFTHNKASTSKDESGYSRLCQASDDKQPVVLTQAQYDRMIEEYDTDQQKDEIAFILYPLRGTADPVIAPGVKEVYTLLQYGSDPIKQNYYFCPYLYCLKDEIMIRPKDFEASIDREGRSKPPMTCPFCHGRMFDDKMRTNPVSGFTVIRRKHKKTAKISKGHESADAPVYIGFHKGSVTQTGFAMPCCFLKLPDPIRIKDTPFEKLRKVIGEGEISDDEGDDIEIAQQHELYAVAYSSSLQRVHTDYILGADKYPLNAGKFAVLSPQYDKYFSQDSTKIAERVQIRTTLRPKSEGFIRMGTEFSYTESILGVIAPLFGRNSIREVKDLILEKCIPRVYLSLGFGNTLIEFFNPSDSEPTDNELRQWSSKYLEVDVNSDNKTALSRAYRSYNRFRLFINDPMQKKEARHIMPLIGQPKLFTQAGIIIAILESDYNTSIITMNCPSYGISAEQRDTADIAFVEKGPHDNYNLFVYTKNTIGGGKDGNRHETFIKWSHISRSNWPKIVLTRASELVEQCNSRHTGLYTSQSSIDNMAIPPASFVIGIMRQYPEGIIRDSYNHLVALTFRTRSGRKISPLAAVPVVDDGSLSGLQLRIHLGWNDYDEAPINEVVQFYKESVESLMTLYSGFKVRTAVRRRSDAIPDNNDSSKGTANSFIAIQLDNGLYIPVKPAVDNLSGQNLPIVEIDEFEWEINQKISNLAQCAPDRQQLMDMTGTQIDDIYQTFKMMVSHWISGPDAGPNVRKSIEEIVFNHKLPDYEKRKRLDIILSPVLARWFAPTSEHIDAPFSLLRRDCRIIDTENACNGTCAWIENKCLLKVNSDIKLGSSRIVSTTSLFVKRVIDDLVRFQNRREKILHRGISEMSKLITPIRSGDQYIIPENIPNPFSMLRLDWSVSDTIKEGKKYIEEMTSL